MASVIGLEAAPAVVGLSDEALRRLDAHLHRCVDDGRFPGVVTLVARRGRVAHLDAYGSANVETGTAMRPDTIVRMASMTKPIVSVALMLLYEEGRILLEDPVSRYLPEFAGHKVFAGGTAAKPRLEEPWRPMSVRDLLTHTSGLIYSQYESSPVAEIYDSLDIGIGTSSASLADFVERLGRVPLACHPGEKFIYSVSTDVVGRLVEVVSGEPIDAFLAERILEPLGMDDTGFFVSPEKEGRFAFVHTAAAGGELEVTQTVLGRPTSRPAFISPGGGLTSTALDYARFCQALLDDGAGRSRLLLGRKTVELMTANHLDGDIASLGTQDWAPDYAGIGFGLGFAVALDPPRMQMPASVGQYFWTGACSTIFWIDPVEELVVIVLTQLVPSINDALRSEVSSLVYPGLLD